MYIFSYRFIFQKLKETGSKYTSKYDEIRIRVENIKAIEIEKIRRENEKMGIRIHQQ